MLLADEISQGVSGGRDRGMQGIMRQKKGALQQYKYSLQAPGAGGGTPGDVGAAAPSAPVLPTSMISGIVGDMIIHTAQS